MSCYRKLDGAVNSTNDSVCSDYVYADGVTPCCDRGHAARCTPNNLCYQPFWIRSDGRQTGWLTAACSDESYNSGACNTHCSSNSHPDVVYNGETSLWHCCGETEDGGTDCNNPTSETFEAASPESLMLAANIAVSSSTTSTTSLSTISSTGGVSTVTVTGSSESATTSVTTMATSSNSGLSTGAKAGIGIGVAIGAIGLICGIISLVWIVRLRKKSIQPQHESHAAPPYTYNNSRATKAEYQQPPKESFGRPPQVHEAPDSSMREGDKSSVHDAHVNWCTRQGVSDCLTRGA